MATFCSKACSPRGKDGSFGNATLTGPRGNVLSANPSDSVTGVGDLYPQASLKGHDGNHNFMAYTVAGVPVGAYEVGRLANRVTRTQRRSAR